MPETNPGKESSEPLSTDFSWDTLPELAKDRWEQMVAYSTTIENQLANAKASRTQAEAERQRIANEILSATKEACQEIVAAAKRTLKRINRETEKAKMLQEQAQLQSDEAKTSRTEAEGYREAVIARAEQQAEEMLQRAQSEAEAASTLIKQQVTFEAQHILAQAEAMRAAAGEELEAQRIYSEASMLKAQAHEALDHMKTQFCVSQHPRITDPHENGVPMQSVNGTGAAAQAGGLKHGATTTGALGAPEQHTPTGVEPVDVNAPTAEIGSTGAPAEAAQPAVTPASISENEAKVSRKARSKTRRVRPT